MNSRMTRRKMLARSAAVTTGFWLGASTSRVESADDKLKVACIGLGGQGGANVSAVAGQEVVAVCDVDEVRAGKNWNRFPGARQYHDFRKMFDEMEKQIDAVVISTPDHTHFHPTYWALQRSKHVYLEKPMAHNVWQVRKLTDLAREKKVATQLGVQRHTIPNMARVVELIRAKVIGEVTEVHSWIASSRGMPKDPGGMPEIPKTMHWDLWLGPAPQVAYNTAFAPYNWRFWWDYGTGETGNWGCHVLDIPYWALDLKHPTRVSASGPEVHDKKTPTALSSRFEFAPTKERGAITLHWYQTSSPAILKEKGIDPKGINNVFIGTKGILACGFNERKLYPVEQFRDFKAPEQTIRPSPGFHQEWFRACRGGPPATCNFDYTGPMTETVLLANVAYRAGGKGFDWDAQNVTAKGHDLVNRYIREEARKGWEIA